VDFFAPVAYSANEVSVPSCLRNARAILASMIPFFATPMTMMVPQVLFGSCLGRGFAKDLKRHGGGTNAMFGDRLLFLHVELGSPESTSRHDHN
jgi:prepilin-type processing-associated H-X9-DG protein